MDVTQATKYYQSLIHSHGCLLFSIEQEKSALRQRKDNAIAVEMTKVNTKLQRYCSQSQNRFRAYSETLKGIVDAIPNSNRDMSILCAAEYVPIGTAKLKGLEQYSTIPYIVPFLGKNSIAVEGTGLATDIMLKSIMISALEQTAAGQLSVSIYNPEWRDTFSCFAILDDFESISSQDGLSKLFDRLSEQISAADSVLKGQFPSILALRQEAKQPVGQLRLVVITGDDWLQEPPLRSKLVHLLAGAPRAGIGFILQLPAGAAEQLNLDVKKIVLLKESCSGEWKTTLMPNVLVRPYSRKQNDILDIFNGWWNNYNTFESQVRITDRGYIETKLLLHTGVSTARSILNTAITNWEGEANRLLAHDDTAFSHDMRLMPMSPLRIIDVGKMEAKMW